MPRQTYDAVLAAAKAAGGDLSPGSWCQSVIVRELRSLKLLSDEK